MFIERPRQTKRDRAYYRQQARRVKQNRLREAQQVWQDFTPPKVGLAHHHVLGCQKKNCTLCKWDKQFVPHPKDHQTVSMDPSDYEPFWLYAFLEEHTPPEPCLVP